MQALQSPFPIFTDRAGRPLAAGKLYLGVEDDNPETNPVAVYWDAAGTQPAPQPIDIENGVPVRHGTPALVYYATPVSVTVRDRNGQLLLYASSTRELTVGFLNPMTTAGDLIVGGASGVAARLPVGSEGQILAVDSGVPAWIQAPDGFANPMTAAGDLIVGAALGAPDRLAMGADGQVLGVDGTGVKWVDLPEIPTIPEVGFSARRVTSSITSAGVVVFQDVSFGGGFNQQISGVGYDTTTGRFTVPTGCAGYYQFNATIAVDNLAGGDVNPGVGMRVNGSAIIKPMYAIRQGVGSLYVFTPILKLSVGDIVDVYYDAAVTSAVLQGSAFSGLLLRQS